MASRPCSKMNRDPTACMRCSSSRNSVHADLCARAAIVAAIRKLIRNNTHSSATKLGKLLAKGIDF